MEKAEFIADLIEIKNHNLQMQRFEFQKDLVASNPVFYSLMDSLIANLCDKYKVSYRDIEKVFRERSLTNPSQGIK